MGNARFSSRNVNKAGQVAAVAESRRKPGSDPVDKQHSKDMQKINRHVEKQNQ